LKSQVQGIIFWLPKLLGTFFALFYCYNLFNHKNILTRFSITKPRINEDFDSGCCYLWNFHQDLTRSSLVEDLVPSRLNLVLINFSFNTTIRFGSSSAPNENLVLILFKFRLGKQIMSTFTKFLLDIIFYCPSIDLHTVILKGVERDLIGKQISYFYWKYFWLI
jgi:hypothetical protein